MAFGFFEPSKGETQESIRRQRQVTVREVIAGIEGHGQTRH